MKRLAILGLLWGSVAFSNSSIVKVIDLHYQQADAMIPVLQPLLLQGETITGQGQQLVVSVSPETLTKCRLIIHDMDQPPVVFNVRIHQGNPDWISADESNDDVYGAASERTAGDTQSIQVMNGAAAFVATGANRPVLSSVSGGWWRGVSYGRDQTQEGLYIQPILQGDRVKITVHRVRQRANPMNGDADQTGALDTVTLIPLDRWTFLGSSATIDNGASAEDSDTYGSGDSFANTAGLFITIHKQ